MAVKYRGKVLRYDESKGEGSVVTNTGEVYPFRIAGWEEIDVLPEADIAVTFEESGGDATVIRAVRNESGQVQIRKEAVAPGDEFEEAVTTESVIHEYFSGIHHEISQYASYEKVPHGIDFLKLRRFLMTTYNNLVDMDLELKHTEIAGITRDLMRLSEIYDGFTQRSRHIKKAFYELFLNRNDEFQKAQHKLESNKESIAKHDINIAVAEGAMAKLENILKKLPETSEKYPLAVTKMTSVRSKAVDAIHLKRELEEENFRLAQFIDMIITENEESFRSKYVVQARRFEEKITRLLDKLAYSFDLTLWKKARASKAIREYFRRSNITGQLSSLTYLRYYLNSLNTDKLSDENRALFDLIPHLESLQRRSIVYLGCEEHHAHRIKKAILSSDKHSDVTMTLEAEKAVARIKKELPDYIFIDQKADFKSVIKVLRMMGNADEVDIVLLVDTVSASMKEQAEKIHINHLLETRTTTHALHQALEGILKR